MNKEKEIYFLNSNSNFIFSKYNFPIRKKFNIPKPIFCTGCKKKGHFWINGLKEVKKNIWLKSLTKIRKFWNQNLTLWKKPSSPRIDCSKILKSILVPKPPDIPFQSYPHPIEQNHSNGILEADIHVITCS